MNGYDYLIVGCGFSGAVLAERLASQLNKTVLIIDKRDHIGGNSYDYVDETGILVHKYGPHYFRTNSQKVFDYLSKFTEWNEQVYKVKSSVNGKLYTIPINRDTLNQFFGINLQNEQEAKDFLETKKINIGPVNNSEDNILSQAGKEIYDTFFKNYTIKQWGCSAKKLSKTVSGRIPIRTNLDDRYFTEKIQVMPKAGYHNLFKNLLNHPNITIKLNTEFDSIKELINREKVIFTGCIDEFFKFKYKKLPYRSLKFKFEHYDQEFYQEFVQINYPNNYDYTRIVEIKHVTGQKASNTTIVKEYPSESGDPFYPIPNKENNELYEKYKNDAKGLKDVIFIGRLGKYKYYNMDQVVLDALNLLEEIKNGYI